MSENLNLKIIAGLERISEVFKTMYWEKAKAHNISPIQIQILIFLSNHKPELCSVSRLAQEFDLTKPTISDAVRVLVNKGLAQKQPAPNDSRSFTLVVSDKGKKMVKDLERFSEPLLSELAGFDENQLQPFYTTLTQLIFKLNRSGILSVQRTCYACRFYAKKSGGHYCNLLQTPLMDREIRIDCPDFESKD